MRLFGGFGGIGGLSGGLRGAEVVGNDEVGGQVGHVQLGSLGNGILADLIEPSGVRLAAELALDHAVTVGILVDTDKVDQMVAVLSFHDLAVAGGTLAVEAPIVEGFDHLTGIDILVQTVGGKRAAVVGILSNQRSKVVFGLLACFKGSQNSIDLVLGGLLLFLGVDQIAVVVVFAALKCSKDVTDIDHLFLVVVFAFKQNHIVAQLLRLFVTAGGAVVGDDTCVGISVTVNKDVGIWPRKIIDTGCTLDNDMVWDNTAKRDLLSNGVIRIKNSEDIHINDIMKYSASFSSLFDGDGVVCVGMSKSENMRYIQSVYHSICSGVIAQSNTCIKINDTTLPIFKRFIKDNKCDGGIYTGEANSEIITVFLDKNGDAVSSPVQKKICTQWGMISSLPHRTSGCNVIENNTTVQMYENAMCNEFSHLKGMKGNVNVIGDDAVSTSLLSRILTRLGFNASGNEGLLFTVSINKMGDTALLMDERNNKIATNTLNTLVSVLRREKGKDNSTSISLDIVRGISIKNVHNGENNSNTEYSYCSDSVYFTLSLLEHMNKSQKTVSEIIQGLPNIYISEKTVKCPWDKKGRIMRELYSRHNCDSDNNDMGIKINHDYGWSVIMPGEEKPMFKIISEGFSMEYAEELCSIYAKKINQLLCEN